MDKLMIMTMKFTCIGKGHGAPCLPATREDWERLRREPWLAQMCARIEKGDDELKHHLPVWTPHCAEFRDNHRAIADALRPLNRLMLDFDEKGHTDEIMEKLHKRDGSFCVNSMEVLLIEESARRGTHVLVELPEGMDAETAQQLMAEATGFTPDAAVKDVSRCIYMVNAAGINVIMLDKKGKEQTKNPHKIDKKGTLKVRFVLSRNATATNGMRTIYVRVINPSGDVINGGGTCSMEGAQVAYTAKQDVEYTGQEKLMELFVPKTSLIEGRYTVQVIADGHEIGSRAVEMEN